MTRINDLSVYSIGTSPNSVNFWGIWNAKDYRIGASSLGGFLSQPIGCTLSTSTTIQTIDTNTPLIFSQVLYGASSYFNANSAGGVTIFHGKFSYVSLHLNLLPEGGGGEPVKLYVQKNSTIVATAGYRAHLMTGDTQIGDCLQFHTGPIPVSSGDILSIFSYSQFFTEGSNTGRQILTVMPEMFA